MRTKTANVKHKKQYEALEEQGMSKERAAKIANSPKASKHGGKQSGSGGNSRQGGTTAQHKAAGRKGGTAAAAKKKRESPPRPRAERARSSGRFNTSLADSTADAHRLDRVDTGHGSRHRRRGDNSQPRNGAMQ